MAKVKVVDVKITHERFREEFGEVEELAVSIQRYGLLHPIVVDEKLNLIAGERRLKAHHILGLSEIEVKHVKELSELEKKEIEIEENMQRKDFTWQETVKATEEIDKIKRELYGHAIPGHGGGWGQQDTADSIGGVSVGTVNRSLKLAQAIEEFPQIAKEKTKDAAWKMYLKLKEGRLTEALAEKVVIDVDMKCLVYGDSSVEMRKLESKSVDLVWTDPPFALGMDSGAFKSAEAWAGKTYEDDKRVLDTISLVVKECYRVLKDDRHMYIFFGIQHIDYVRKIILDVGFNVGEVPCIWHKTGGGGAGGSEYAYASNYEAFFLAMKGRRPLNKLGQSNVFVESRVAPQYKRHPMEKPSALIRGMIEQSSQAGEMVIDPFAGSAKTLLAAYQTKRKCWGCEKDKEYYSGGLLLLQEYKKSLEG